MPELVYRFAEALRGLLAARSARAFERRWNALELDALGWDALAHARRRDVRRWERALDEVDGLLLRLLDRVPLLAAAAEPAACRVRTFQLAELERLQHATAAALVAQRYGPAGLRVVVADQDAPLARRYYAFLALGERHRRKEWALFSRYLTPEAHHAFVGIAAEAARFYPERGAALRLVALFEAVRTDLQLREFLSPRILESLHVLADRRCLPLCRSLLTTGHTQPHPDGCEVTRALVLVRRLTGAVEPNTKYPRLDGPRMHAVLDSAEAAFDRQRDTLRRVAVI